MASWRVHVTPWYDMPTVAAKMKRFAVYLSDEQVIYQDVIMSRLETTVSRRPEVLEDFKAANAWRSILEALAEHV